MVWLWVSAEESQRGPLSESGEGIALPGAAMTVVAVLVEEALEAEAEDGPIVGSCTVDGMWPGMPSCGRAPPDDVSEGDDDDGGDGSRDAAVLAVGG